MPGPWEKYSQPAPGGLQRVGPANPKTPLEVRVLQNNVTKGNAEAANAATIAEAQAKKAQADAIKAQADAAAAQMGKEQEAKIGELRQRDANLRSLADQIVVTRKAYDDALRGGWPNWIAGQFPTSAQQNFETNADTLVDVGQSAFRIPGSGDQNAQELKNKMNAVRPQSTKADAANDANFDYLRRRLDTERKALGLPPIDWNAISQTSQVALPTFAPNIATGVTRGAGMISGDGSSSGPSELAQKFTQAAQDAFNNGATRQQLDALAQSYGAQPFGEDLDAAIRTRDAGGRASFIEPNDVQTGPQDILGMRPDGAVGAFFTAAGNQALAGRLDELAGTVNGPDAGRIAQAGKEYLRSQHPIASIAGDVAGIIPMAMGGAAALSRLGLSAPRAALGADIGTGALTGSGENNESPTFGGIVGGFAGYGGNKAGSGLMSLLGRGVSPTGGAVTSAYEQGVNPTIGQRFADKGIIGRGINTAEQALQSVPFLGALPANARQAARDQWERGAYNRALKPINNALPDGVQAGPQAMAHSRKAFDDAYDAARSGMQFVPDGQFSTDFGAWQIGVRGSGLLDGESIKQVEKAVANTVGSRMRGGQLTGDTYKKAVSDLNKIINKSSKPEVQTALSDFRSIMDASARRNSNPSAVAAMDAADLGYSQFKPLKDAGRMAGSEPGRFTPAGLASVERRTMGKTNAFLEGNTRMGDYIAAGQNLRDTLPNSGTAERLMTGQAVVGAPAMGGAAFLDPTGTLPMGIAAATAPYSPGIRDLIAQAMAPRQNPVVKQIGDMIYNQRRLGGAVGAPLAISGASQSNW